MFGMINIPARIEDLALFSRHLAGAMAARVPLGVILRAYGQDAASRALGPATGEMANQVEQGVPLYETMDGRPDLFPAGYRRLVRMGEENGALGDIMVRLADMMDTSLRSYEAFRRAAIYPLFVSVLLALNIIALYFYFTPDMTDMTFQNQLVPGSATSTHSLQQLGLVAVFISALLLIGALSIAGALMGLRWRCFGSGRWLLNLPVFGPVLRKAETARIIQHLGLLLEHGLPLHEALGALAESAENSYVGDMLCDFQNKCASGDRLSAVVASHPLFPAGLGALLASAEDTGQLSQTLRELGAYYEQRANHGLLIAREIFEPVMLLLVGLLVGMTMLSFYGPLFIFHDTGF